MLKPQSRSWEKLYNKSWNLTSPYLLKRHLQFCISKNETILHRNSNLFCISSLEGTLILCLKIMSLTHLFRLTETRISNRVRARVCNLLRAIDIKTVRRWQISFVYLYFLLSNTQFITKWFQNCSFFYKRFSQKKIGQYL